MDANTFTWAGLLFDYSKPFIWLFDYIISPAGKRQSPTPNMLKPKDPKCLTRNKFPLSITSVEIVCQRNAAFELLWLQITTTASVRAFLVLLDTDNAQKKSFIVTWAFCILNYSGEMHSWCNWREWSYTRDHFSSTNVVQMISHWHTFQLKIMQNEIFWYFRFTCSGEKIWRSSIRIHGITAASNQISNIGWYLTVYWHLLKEIHKSFYSNLKCQGQTRTERVLPAEVLDLMPDFRDP